MFKVNDDVFLFKIYLLSLFTQEKSIDFEYVKKYRLSNILFDLFSEKTKEDQQTPISLMNRCQYIQRKIESSSNWKKTFAEEKESILRVRTVKEAHLNLNDPIFLKERIEIPYLGVYNLYTASVPYTEYPLRNIFHFQDPFTSEKRNNLTRMILSFANSQYNSIEPLINTLTYTCGVEEDTYSFFANPSQYFETLSSETDIIRFLRKLIYITSPRFFADYVTYLYYKLNENKKGFSNLEIYTVQSSLEDTLNRRSIINSTKDKLYVLSKDTEVKYCHESNFSILPLFE